MRNNNEATYKNITKYFRYLNLFFLLCMIFNIMPTKIMAQESNELFCNDYGPAIASEGHFIAFESGLDNFVINDLNFVKDIFVYDLETSNLEIVSIASNGTQSVQSNEITSKSISADGRYVVFSSSSNNLDEGIVNVLLGDTNNVQDIFIHDRNSTLTTRISTSVDGMAPNGPSACASISNDSQLIVFTSLASNLVEDDTNAASDIYIYERKTSRIRRISIASDGTQGNGNSKNAILSGNGRFVVFESDASNLVPVDTNDLTDLFVHDLKTAQTTIISIASDGTQSHNELYDEYNAHISYDGRLISFTSSAPDLVMDDTNESADIFIHNRITGETKLVSIGFDGMQTNADSNHGVLSNDGHFVFFASKAPNLVNSSINDSIQLVDDINEPVVLLAHEHRTGNTAKVSIRQDNIINSSATNDFIVLDMEVADSNKLEELEILIYNRNINTVQLKSVVLPNLNLGTDASQILLAMQNVNRAYSPAKSQVTTEKSNTPSAKSSSIALQVGFTGTHISAAGADGLQVTEIIETLINDTSYMSLVLKQPHYEPRLLNEIATVILVYQEGDSPQQREFLYRIELNKFFDYDNIPPVYKQRHIDKSSHLMLSPVFMAYRAAGFTSIAHKERKDPFGNTYIAHIVHKANMIEILTFELAKNEITPTFLYNFSLNEFTESDVLEWEYANDYRIHTRRQNLQWDFFVSIAGFPPLFIPRNSAEKALFALDCGFYNHTLSDATEYNYYFDNRFQYRNQIFILYSCTFLSNMYSELDLGMDDHLANDNLVQYGNFASVFVVDGDNLKLLWNKRYQDSINPIWTDQNSDSTPELNVEIQPRSHWRQSIMVNRSEPYQVNSNGEFIDLLYDVRDEDGNVGGDISFVDVNGDSVKELAVYSIFWLSPAAAPAGMTGYTHQLFYLKDEYAYLPVNEQFDSLCLESLHGIPRYMSQLDLEKLNALLEDEFGLGIDNIYTEYFSQNPNIDIERSDIFASGLLYKAFWECHVTGVSQARETQFIYALNRHFPESCSGFMQLIYHPPSWIDVGGWPDPTLRDAEYWEHIFERNADLCELEEPSALQDAEHYIEGFYVQTEQNPWGEIQQCDSFTITDGSAPLIYEFRDMLEEGNTINSLNESYQVVINLDLSSIDEALIENLKSSTATKPIGLTIKRPSIPDMGVDACFSLVEIQNVDDIIR